MYFTAGEIHTHSFDWKPRRKTIAGKTLQREIKTDASSGYEVFDMWREKAKRKS